MRILVVHHRYRVRGGEDQAVDREVALLAGGGVEVEIWERDSQEIRGILPKARAALEIPYSESSRDELAGKLAAYRPDLVHVHNWFPTFTPSIYDACEAARIPVVQTLHNFRIFCASGLLAREGGPCELCLGGSTWPALRYACYQGSRPSTYALTRMIDQHREADTWNRKVKAFIALSHFSARKFVQGGIRPEKIHVKPNFAFEPLASEEKENYALFVGRLDKEKGVRTLLRAWESLRVPLWIVGDGPLRAELETLKARNPLVRILGPMPAQSVARIMGKARFLVVPSECYENFPLVVAEGYAAGLPVVASRLGAVAELVEDGKTGLLFTPGSPEDLARMVERLVASPDLQKQLSAGARSAYLDRYTAGINLRRLREIYQTALAVKDPV